MGKRKFLFVFFFFFCGLLLRASEFRFTHLGVTQGLSSSTVKAIFCDSRGFTWIATSTGLNRFDGETFTVYTHHRKDSTSLPDDQVRSITEDHNGMLWIGTENGIARFNPWNGKAEKIRQQSLPGFPNTPCNFAFVDQSGNIWAKALDVIWKYDTRKNAFLPVLACDGKNDHPYRCAYFQQDKKGRYWISADDGLFLFNPQTGALKKYEILPGQPGKNLIVSTFEDHAGNLWCATWGNGLARFLPEEEKFITYKWVPHPENPSATNLVFGYTETFSENHYSLWAACNSGLALITDATLASAQPVAFIRHDATKPGSISSNQVNCVAGNAWGQLWAGTDNDISVLLPEQQLFQDFAPQFKGATTHIVKDGEGGFFISSWYGNGLQHFDSQGNLLRCWKHIPENSTALDCGQVGDVLKAKDGSLWVATFGGLSHGDAAGNHFTQILPEEGNPNSICSMHINCIAEDKEGNIWCGSYNHGISVLKTDGSVENFTRKGNDNTALANDLVWGLHCASTGEIWVATDYGISIYDPATKKFDTRKFIVREKDSLPFGVSLSFFEDSKGITWISTNNGLFFQRKDKSFGVYLKEDGLADNAVRGIQEDAEGNIWISTANGLSKLDPRSSTFTNYSIGSGLPSSDLSGDFGSGPDGKLLIGLSDRIVEFNPQRMKTSANTSTVYFTGILVSGKSFFYAKNPSTLPAPEFHWDENTFSFDFVSPGFRGDPLVKYAYRLEGGDNKWISSGTRHFASYVGLPPGNYSFQCRASVSNGPWSQPATFSFIIHPPFWKTWWFMISATLLSLFLVVFVVRREATRKIREQLLVLEKQQAVEKERNRISRDMHDDLGSGLTKIAILSEVVKSRIRPDDDSQKQVNIISESSRELVDNLNEIIWALNPDNDNLSNLSAYIREYADRYLEPFGIDLHFQIPEHLPPLHLSEEKRRNVFLVVKEALHNIVKHAGAKRVEIFIAEENGKPFIEVRDDGKGFEQSTARPLGNGLKSMQKRAAAIGASVIMKSKPGEGCSVKITLDEKA